MKFGIHSEQYANNYSKEERKKFTQVFGDLTLKFAEKMKEQVAACLLYTSDAADE